MCGTVVQCGKIVARVAAEAREKTTRNTDSGCSCGAMDLKTPQVTVLLA
jgi:hypothetical protein